MTKMINGVKVVYPAKLDGRLDEITELVGMVKELAMKKSTKVDCIHVWETSRHELCYADFTVKKTKPEETKPVEPKDPVYFCYGCVCKSCVRNVDGGCNHCKQCGNKPKQMCPRARVFDPRLVESAKILKAFNCGDNVEFNALQSAIEQMLRVYESVKYFVEDERFEGKLIYDVTIESCPMVD